MRLCEEKKIQILPCFFFLMKSIYIYSVQSYKLQTPIIFIVGFLNLESTFKLSPIHSHFQHTDRLIAFTCQSKYIFTRPVSM
jgi:hypothetical protein